MTRPNWTQHNACWSIVCCLKVMICTSCAINTAILPSVWPYWWQRAACWPPLPYSTLLCVLHTQPTVDESSNSSCFMKDHWRVQKGPLLVSVHSEIHPVHALLPRLWSLSLPSKIWFYKWVISFSFRPCCIDCYIYRSLPTTPTQMIILKWVEKGGVWGCRLESNRRQRRARQRRGTCWHRVRYCQYQTRKHPR